MQGSQYKSLSSKATMSGEKTGANMEITTTKPTSSTPEAEASAHLLATNSSQPLVTTSFPTPTTSLGTAEASTSDPTTASPPDFTPFPDLNLQTATLLARLKNPSLLSTEELLSATAAASAALSAWEAELLTINATKKRERRRKPAPHEGTRPTKPNTSRKEKKSVWKDWNDGEEELLCANQGTATKTSRASSDDLEPPPNNISDSSSCSSSSSGGGSTEERQKWKAKADKAAKHSARMREVWAKRRAEGTNGRKGGQPLPSTVERSKKGADRAAASSE